jgi:hypothetical protein
MIGGRKQMQENTVLICSCTGLNGELLNRHERGVVDLISIAIPFFWANYRYKMLLEAVQLRSIKVK